MVTSDQEFERFVADSFDSEESVMIVLALRDEASSFSVREVLERLERDFGLEVVLDRRVAEKRVELRLRDLSVRELVRLGSDGRYRYTGDESGRAELVERTSIEFGSRRVALNRLIYSPSARARRLAEAFRL